MSTLSFSAVDAGLDIEALYAEHAVFLGGAIRQLAGEGPHVDDILQETFVAAHRQRTRFEGRSSVRTWLYAIASNQTKKHLRRRKMRALLFGRARQREVPVLSEAPDANVDRGQRLALARRVLERMPFKQRQVFVMYELEQMEGRDIAETLGIPVGTVWTRLHKARARFQRALARRGGEEA